MKIRNFCDVHAPQDTMDGRRNLVTVINRVNIRNLGFTMDLYYNYIFEIHNVFYSMFKNSIDMVELR